MKEKKSLDLRRIEFIGDCDYALTAYGSLESSSSKNQNSTRSSKKPAAFVVLGWRTGHLTVGELLNFDSKVSGNYFFLEK